MLPTNLSASLQTSSEKANCSQVGIHHANDQASLPSPPTTRKAATSLEKLSSPVIRSHDRALNSAFRTPEKLVKSKSAHTSPVVSPRSPRKMVWAEDIGESFSPRSPRKMEADALRVDRHRIVPSSPRSPRTPLVYQASEKAVGTISSPSHHGVHRMSAPPVLSRTPALGLPPGRQAELAQTVALALIDTAKTEASKPKKSMQQKSPTEDTLSPRTPASSILTDSVCQAFARFEYKISKSYLPADLLALLPSDEQTYVTHTALIKVLFMQKLKESPAGKTITAMKTVVMQQHSADGLKLGTSDADERKKSAMTAMRANANAVVDMCFGAGSKGLASSQLPKALIDFWKIADAALVAWALDNPDLSLDKIAGVRSNLGIDIILTRQIYPMIFGHADEAHLAVPGWFGTTVREAAMQVWPAFFNDFVQSANMDLPIPLQAALAERATPKASADVQAHKILPEKSAN